MVPEVPYLVAVICPDVFCQPKQRAAIKRQLREALAAGDRKPFHIVAAKAEPVAPNQIPLEHLEAMNPFDLPGQRSPAEEHTLILDHVDDPLEPVYFSLLDELRSRDGWLVEKLVDTASATPGSGLGLDLNRRTLLQQQEITKLLVSVQRQVRDLVRHWQNWRGERRTLALYDQAVTATAEGREAALHQLRKRWRDETGNGNPFTEPNEEEQAAFETWIKQSATELQQRLEVDRRLLAGELNLLKLQASWVRPYLTPRQQSRQTEDPDLVSGFNTALFEIVLAVRVRSDLERAVQAGELPQMLLHSRYRRSQPILIVTLQFRAVPSRTNGGAYAYRGRVTIGFSSYALNEEELAVLRREIQRCEWGEIFGMLEQNSAGNLDELLNDLDELLVDGETTSEQSAPVSEDANPFSALLSVWELFKAGPAKTGSPAATLLRPDSEIERVLRSFALLEARKWCRELYEQQKRSREMPVLGE